jgi:hypothetical protein
LNPLLDHDVVFDQFVLGLHLDCDCPTLNLLLDYDVVLIFAFWIFFHLFLKFKSMEDLCMQAHLNHLSIIVPNIEKD